MAERSEFYKLREVAEKTGMSLSTLRSRVREGTVAVYADPRHRQRYLISADDVSKLTRVELRSPAKEAVCGN